MIKNICIVEDNNYKNLLPLVYMRPVYDLRCGILTLKEKIKASFPFAKIFLHCRKYLEEKVKETNPGYLINDLNKLESCLIINGRVILNPKTVEQISKKIDVVYFCGDTFVAANLSGNNLENFRAQLNSTVSPSLFDGIEKVQCETTIINYPWDLVSNNGKEIISDFVFHKAEKKNLRGKIYEGAYLLNKKNIYIGEDSVIKPGVVIDAEEGPVYIGKNVKVMPNSVIIGPCCIGDNSIIKIGAKIFENTSIGECCKISGEVVNSIIHSYANKQHDGFLGHSYISPWCNLGAGTNTSNLKINYSNVKVNLNGNEIDTGLMFVGLIMGDHSKSSINVMFNSGTICGVSSTILGNGFAQKNIRSFSWGGSDSFTVYKFEKAVEVAKIATQRRNIKFTEADAKLFYEVFEMTSSQRK